MAAPIRRQLEAEETLLSGGRKQKGYFTEWSTPFRLDWLPGQDSNLRPAGYKCPDFSTGLGLSLHPPARTYRGGCRALL